MPSIKPLVLKDNASQDFTLNPDTPSQGRFPFIKSNGSPIGDVRATVTLKKTSERAKVDLTIASPVVITETINGVERPVVDRANYASIKLNFAANSTETERREMRALLRSMLADDQPDLSEVIVDLEGYY